MEGNGGKMSVPIWQLPVDETGEEMIHPNAKYHCFVDCKSLCGKYDQDTDFFETSIESGQIVQLPTLGCQKCYKKWKAKFYMW